MMLLLPIIPLLLILKQLFVVLLLLLLFLDVASADFVVLGVVTDVGAIHAIVVAVAMVLPMLV
jgi:hypothetical protein